MKNFNDIEKLVELFEKSSLTVMEVEVEGLKVKFDKRNFDEPQVVSTPMAYPTTEVKNNNNTNALNENTKVNDDENAKYITSPLVGTFHQGPTANAAALVKVGDVVHKGQKLCMIEAMKVMNEITATTDGKILAVLVEDGSMVEYGQKLFKIGE